MKKVLSIFLMLIALSCRVYASDVSLHVASDLGNLGEVKSLLENGVNVDTLNSSKETPLYLASKAGHTRIVKLLLEHGANPNAKKYCGKTPLIAACKYKYINTAKLLLKYGANVNDILNENITPLFEACCGYDAAMDANFNLVKLLLDHGADADPQPLKNGATPLSKAVENISYKTAILLLEHGAKPNNDTCENMPILNYLCNSIYTPEEYEAEKLRLIEALLQHGADVDYFSKCYATPLFLACRCNNIDVVKLLLEYGANVNIPVYTDIPGYTEITPLQIARKNNNTEIVELLLEYGACEQQQNQHELGNVVKPDTECPFFKIYNSYPCEDLMKAF